MKLAPPAKEVVAMKIKFAKVVRTIKRTEIDWNFWLQFGTFLATLYAALK